MIEPKLRKEGVETARRKKGMFGLWHLAGQVKRLWVRRSHFNIFPRLSWWRWSMPKFVLVILLQ